MNRRFALSFFVRVGYTTQTEGNKAVMSGPIFGEWELGSV